MTKPSPFAAFDLDEGGVLCGDVRALRRPARRRRTALALLRRILGGDLRGVLAEPPDRPGTRSSGSASAALEHHLERRLRSAALL